MKGYEKIMPKKIGIVGAMEQEIELLRSMLEDVNIKNAAGSEFIQGRLYDRDVVLVRCGVGKVNAAVCTQALLDLCGADYIVNTGVAGGIARGVGLGDVVITTDFVQHDFDCVGAGYAAGVIPGDKPGFYKADGALAARAAAACDAVFPESKVHTGLIATGDRFVTSSEAVRSLRESYNPLCVDMETAAIAQTCALNGVPFVAVRSISDNADEEAGMTFEQYLKLAAEESCRVVCQMVKDLE